MAREWPRRLKAARNGPYSGSRPIAHRSRHRTSGGAAGRCASDKKTRMAGVNRKRQLKPHVQISRIPLWAAPVTGSPVFASFRDRAAPRSNKVVTLIATLRPVNPTSFPVTPFAQQMRRIELAGVLCHTCFAQPAASTGHQTCDTFATSRSVCGSNRGKTKGATKNAEMGYDRQR